MHEFLLIGGMTLVTFSVRYVLLAVSGRFRLPAAIVQALNYVPPAVLMAIVTPAIFIKADQLWLSPNNPRIWGAIAAFAIGFWRQNLLLTILMGMTVFLLGQFWLGQGS